MHTITLTPSESHKVCITFPVRLTFCMASIKYCMFYKELPRLSYFHIFHFVCFSFVFFERRKRHPMVHMTNV